MAWSGEEGREGRERMYDRRLRYNTIRYDTATWSGWPAASASWSDRAYTRTDTRDLAHSQAFSDEGRRRGAWLSVWEAGFALLILSWAGYAGLRWAGLADLGD